jgi:hypothetical protein
LVGISSKGRKGTSWGRIDRLFSTIEPDWHRITTGGLVSGEGIIYHLSEDNPDNEAHQDKRALCIEEELASILQAMNRDGNTLSATLRQLWDGREVIQTLAKTKERKAKATGATRSPLAAPFRSLAAALRPPSPRRSAALRGFARGCPRGSRPARRSPGSQKRYLPSGTLFGVICVVFRLLTLTGSHKYATIHLLTSWAKRCW